MQAQALKLPHSKDLTRTAAAALAALFASLALFGLMYGVIHGSGHGIDKAQTLPTIDFVRLKRDTQVETLERRKPPPPPPPKAPPPPQKMRVATTDAAPTPQTPNQFDMPNLGLSVGTGGTGPFVGSGGGGGAPISAAGMLDSDIIPLQRMSPQYPREAARLGITGYVRIELVINPDGSVKSAKAIEAKPKGLFEASAVQAIYKWRFKPKVVGGKPVEQRGIQKIDFNLNP